MGPYAFNADDNISVADGQVQWALVRGSGTEKEELIIVMPGEFIVGRSAGCSLQLNMKTISGNHAELDLVEEQLFVADLGSTNGTYLNGRRIKDRVGVSDGDLLQFADVVYRVSKALNGATSATMQEDMCDDALALVQFDRLMENRLVTPFFQPIVDLATGEYQGYEVLARSRLFGLESCGAMFDAASRLNMEVDLSRMLRWEGIREGLNLPEKPTLFVNTHPREVRAAGLIESMAGAKRLSKDVPIVLEIHEAAITDPAEMLSLREQLRELGIGLAYDDFGAGQTRLTELIEAPPDFLKFDIGLVKNIDKASPERRRTLESLVRVALDLGVNPLAEGIETPEEADVCRKMGFRTAQGYHFGRPAPVGTFQ